MAGLQTIIANESGREINELEEDASQLVASRGYFPVSLYLTEKIRQRPLFKKSGRNRMEFTIWARRDAVK